MKNVVIGFALLALSKFLEAWGDDGSSGAERLPGHLLALLVLILAGFFFVRAIAALFRR